MTARRAATLAAVTAALSAPTAEASGRCGSHAWCDPTLSPAARAELVLDAMTTDEKVGLLGGDDVLGVILLGDHMHTGTQNGVPRLGIPTVLYTDGPLGPRHGKSAGLPMPLAVAATFNPDLAADHGRVVASEARAKGNDVVFGPATNIARTPLSGRTFENYGEDPFLQTHMVVPWIRAAQAQGVIANVKHFAANNQEGVDAGLSDLNSGSPAGLEGSRLAQNSVVEERTLREIYFPHFEAAVKDADVGSVMSALNRVNGTFAYESRWLLTDVLRTQWGFDGYVLGDYVGTHDAAASANAGLDFEPFPPVGYQPVSLMTALTAGGISGSTLDARVRNMLRTWFKFGLFDRDAPLDDDAQIDEQADLATAQAIEEQAITLLQNDDAVLPLDPSKLTSIAVSGAAATAFITGGGSGSIKPFEFRAPLDSIRARAGSDVDVSYAGTDQAAAATKARAADVAIVFVNDYYTEGADRRCLSLQCPRVHGDQDALVRAVASANENTIVVLASGGPDLMPWRDDVRGIFEMWYGGSRSGPAIAKVLFGDVDPSGRLPITFPERESQLPTAGSRARYPGDALQNTHYEEGVLIGYRWFDAQGLEPEFPFGFGLSYTTFEYDRPSIEGRTITFRVRNTGARSGWVTPQLYLGLPQPDEDTVQPPAQLKGFKKRQLAPGQTARFRFDVDDRAISYWDEDGWTIAPGCVGIMVGNSSRDIRLSGELPAGGARCARTATACRSRRKVVFTLPKRVKAAAIRVTVDGRRQKLTLRRGRVVVSLVGQPRRVVKVVLRGRDFRRTSMVRTCVRST